MTNELYDDFRVAMKVAKSYEEVVNDKPKMFISGVASGIGLDRDQERMADTAIKAFEKAVQEGIVTLDGEWSLIPLRSEHRNGWDDVLGWVTKAETDADHNLWITAELDEENPNAVRLFKALTGQRRPGRPTQLGFSVGGKIREVGSEWNEDLKKYIRVIKDIALREVSVVGSPAYPKTFVEALTKSVNWDALEENPMSEVNEVIEKNENVEEAVVTAEATEEVTKAEETKEENVTKSEEPRAAEWFDAIETKLATFEHVLVEIQKSLAAAPAPVASENTQEATEEVNKSTEEESVQTDVQKGATDMEKMFEAFANKFFVPLAEQIEKTNDAVKALSEEPQDRSLAVRKAKEDIETDSFEQLLKSYKESSDLKTKPIIQDFVREALVIGNN